MSKNVLLQPKWSKTVDIRKTFSQHEKENYLPHETRYYIF